IFSEGKEAFGTDKENAFIEKAFSTCVGISIDYGIMEKADNVYVCSADFGWSDIGTWGSLYEYSQKDNSKNSVVGEKIVCNNVSNTIIRIDPKKTAIIDGLDNHIVICEGDKLLICSKDREQSIKSYLDEINRP
ncbi:MAG: mannose-1-phosphate guanylyltransferase, partial [Rikenellaceae bacterium]